MLGLLQTYERDHNLNKGLVNLVGGSGAGHCFFWKGKKKKKNKKVLSVGPSYTRLTLLLWTQTGQGRKSSKVLLVKVFI